MIKEYILKHKDIPLLLFFMDNEKFVVTGTEKIFEAERLPFNSTEYDYNNKSHCLLMLDNWIKSRGLAQSRKDLNKIKDLFKVKDASELTVKSYGLNLTDHYWLHETENDLKWAEVNYFDNTFDKIIELQNANPEIDKSVNIQSPNMCVDGSIEKRWIILNGERVLLKGSRYSRMQEPFNENIASIVMDYYGIDHVHYDIKRTKNKIPYSECKCMINKNIEFVNAQYIMNMEDWTRKEPYGHYAQLCKKKGIEDVQTGLGAMLAIDFLIGNDDRHKGNFGILRDADTLKWQKIAPVFDNGNSLFFDCDNDELKYRGIDSLGKAFGDSNRLNLEYINYPEWYNKDSKIILDIVNQCLSSNERLTQDRVDTITKITKERINVFEEKIKTKRKNF